jgi:heme/copper-type cytochrome/quinol oxidase subunit 2
MPDSMSTMHALTVLAAEEAPAQLFMPTWAFPLVMVVIFVVLALISWSFRDVANRHADREPFPADPHAPHGDEHAAHDPAHH